MHRALCAVGLSAAILGISAPPARAQVIDSAAAVERQVRTGAARDADRLRARGLGTPATGEADKYVFALPSFKFSDPSASFGAGGMFYYDRGNVTGGIGSFAIRPSYVLSRDTDAHTNLHIVGAGADVQLSRSDNAAGIFTASVDYLDFRDAFGYSLAGLTWEYYVADSGAKVQASLGAARLTPDGVAESVSDVVPGMGFEYTTKTKIPVRLSADYTFENDVDGEDDYSFAARVPIGAANAVRGGAGKHGKVFVSFSRSFQLPSAMR